MACSVAWEFSIDDHKLTVIEVEGVPIHKYDTDMIPIHAGQRYSFVLNTTGRYEKKNYWIRANVPLDDTGGPIHKAYPGNAILHYADAPNEDPTDTPPPVFQHVLREQDLKVTGKDIPEEDIHREILEFNESPNNINGTKFVNPETPVLLKILSGVTDPRELLPEGTIVEIPRDKVIEVVFKGLDFTRGNPHPMHLHGHTFAVTRSINQSEYNMPDSPWRDTVATSLFNPPKDRNTSEVTIRFKSDNPGPWIIHCHIDGHLALGMAAVFAERITEIKQNENPPRKSYNRPGHQPSGWQ
ncbi:Laccase-2 [Leucoagaricus sp. SymC.cos]|nr:Laccase-2 [Leucoagaricus sp. SymC.cos]